MATKKVNSKELAKELRKTHFALGTVEPKNKTSVYFTEYQSKPAAFEHSVGEKLNLRASHFSLGDTDPSKQFKSTNQKDFKAYPDHRASTINEDKKRDLRTHHFTLGQYNTGFGTVSHGSYIPKQISIEKQREEQEMARSKMIKHNHNFVEIEGKQYSSEYNKNFNKDVDPEFLKQGLSGEELRQKVVDLRKSHVVLGEDVKPMLSVAQKDYVPKNTDGVKPANDNVAIRRTNFVLGVNPTEYSSISSSYFVPHGQAKQDNTLFEALRQDLRAHHFTLGGENPNYASNNAASFKDHSGYKPDTAFNPLLQQTHWNFGDEGTQKKTSYSNAHRDFGQAAVVQARDQSQDRGSSWKLGYQSRPWMTESHQNFIQQGDGRQIQDEGLKGNLRASHFKFDDLKNPEYKPISKTDFVRKDGKPSVLDEELKKDLRTHHFKYGSNNALMVSSSQLAYKSNQGKPSSLDPNLAKDLRTHHFVHGDGKWQHGNDSEYRNNFDWKVNDDN